MKGSGAPGNWRRAASRSPPCNSGSSVSPWGKMSVALAAFAMLTEMFDGYPPWLLRAIGHPVIWMGYTIATLDRLLNRETTGPCLRRATGVAALLILLAVVGLLAFVVEHALLPVPFFGFILTAFIAGTLIAQCSLYQHVLNVAIALENNGLAAGRAAVAHIV